MKNKLNESKELILKTEKIKIKKIMPSTNYIILIT